MSYMSLSFLEQIQEPSHAHGHIEEHHDCKWTRKEEFVLLEGLFNVFRIPII